MQDGRDKCGGRAYLGFDVVEGRRADNGEADEEDVGLGVGERAQAIIIFLAGGIPETQTYGLAIDHDVCRIIVEARAWRLARVSTRGRQAGRQAQRPTAPQERQRAAAALGRNAGSQGRTHTVGMYSPGKALVVYEMRRHVWRRRG